jgi:hypothetical protein
MRISQSQVYILLEKWMFINVFNYLCMFYSTNEDIRFFVSWGKCAGQRYGALATESATAQLQRVVGYS